MISLTRYNQVHKTEFDRLPIIHVHVGNRLLALPTLLRVSQARKNRQAHMEVTCPIYLSAQHAILMHTSHSTIPEKKE